MGVTINEGVRVYLASLTGEELAIMSRALALYDTAVYSIQAHMPALVGYRRDVLRLQNYVDEAIIELHSATVRRATLEEDNGP